MAKTINELKSAAAVVRDATEDRENTALRIGQLFLDAIETLGEVSTNAIKGFAVISSTDDLPTNPTSEQQQKGYLLGTVLYVYVGTGGDTLDGKYKSADIKGPQGDPGANGHDGVSLGEVALVNNLTEGGEEAALTAEQGKILRENLMLMFNALSEGAFWQGKPTLSWVAGNSFQVINNLDGVSSTNDATSISNGSSYSATLSASRNFDVSITMGGIDITSLVYDSETGAISIASVTGTLVITAGVEPQITIYDGYEIGADGSMVAASGKSVTDFIPFDAAKIVWSAGAIGSVSDAYRLVIYNSNKEYIEYYNCNKGYRILDLTSHAQASNIAYMRITFATSKVGTRICYDITNSNYVFKGDDYDGRYDNFTWGYRNYVANPQSSHPNLISDTTYCFTDFFELPVTCASLTMKNGEATTNSSCEFYTPSKEASSYWNNTPDPRTITNTKLTDGTWRYIKTSVLIDKLDDCYVKDDTNDVYLFKGFNIS